jgi:hypothetical protein
MVEGVPIRSEGQVDPEGIVCYGVVLVQGLDSAGKGSHIADISAWLHVWEKVKCIRCNKHSPLPRLQYL